MRNRRTLERENTSPCLELIRTSSPEEQTSQHSSLISQNKTTSYEQTGEHEAGAQIIKYEAEELSQQMFAKRRGDAVETKLQITI